MSPSGSLSKCVAAAARFRAPRPDSSMLQLRADDVDVWRAALDDQPDALVRQMEALLSADEADRARGFYFERDRRRYIVGRGVLRILVGRYLERTPQSVAFTYGPNGKPGLRGAGEGELFFNVAHSEGLALYAFTRVGEVGIDVERMRDLPDWESVAQAAFCPHELAQLRACPAATRRDEFFRAWTRQEAVLKALGTGLGGATALGAESGFNVYPLEAGADFAAALACSPAARKPTHLFGWSSEAAPTAPTTFQVARPLQTNLP
jgi:4'-phosphopantetheinyl transferase